MLFEYCTWSLGIQSLYTVPNAFLISEKLHVLSLNKSLYVYENLELSEKWSENLSHSLKIQRYSTVQYISEIKP
jgi:hypothetical protein